jgi:hypothetical protein
MHYEPRSEVIFVRVRPSERERAATLAAAEEVHVPELVRRLLAKEWRRAAAQGPLSCGCGGENDDAT